MAVSEFILDQIAQKLELPAKTLKGASLNVGHLQLQKGHYFVQEGEKTDQVGFLVEGLMRKFYPVSSGKDITLNLIFPGGFVAPYSDQLRDLPSFLSIQALEKCHVAVLSFAALMALSLKDPEWSLARMKVAESLFLEKEERESSLLSLSAKERLVGFINRHPDKWKSIPKQVIASYLGINPSTLSRVYKTASAELKA
jgi:CRP-like cAMP-binding protein